MVKFLANLNGERLEQKKHCWWKEKFKDDFYIELVRHGLEEGKSERDFIKIC